MTWFRRLLTGHILSPTAGTAWSVSLLALLLATLFLALGGCHLLQPPEEAPVLITRATLSRSYPEDRHLLALRVRSRAPQLRPDQIELRFRLTAELDPETRHQTDVKASAALLPLSDRDYELMLPFDSPFPFLSRNPLRLTHLTLLAISRDGKTLWTGELGYPYPLDEQLPVGGVSKSGDLGYTP